MRSDFEAKGLPGPDELAVLEPLRAKLKPEVFTQPVPVSPSTDPPGSLRANLREAKALLAEAGWTFRDGALRNAKGRPSPWSSWTARAPSAASSRPTCRPSPSWASSATTGKWTSPCCRNAWTSSTST